MFYRVDYAIGVIVLGFIAGLAVGGKTNRISSSILARRCYIAIAVLVALRAAMFVFSMLSSGTKLWSTGSAVAGDLISLTLGLVFGLAIRRSDARDFLTDGSVIDALCMSLAFTFAMAALGKAFSLGPMTEFFTQSGYSVTFL